MRFLRKLPEKHANVREMYFHSLLSQECHQALKDALSCLIMICHYHQLLRLVIL
jgi:hypothetical protein